MTILGNFNRRKARKSFVKAKSPPSFKRRWKSFEDASSSNEETTSLFSPKSPIQELLRKQPQEKLSITKQTERAIQELVEEEFNHREVTVMALANALAASRTVLDLHCSEFKSKFRSITKSLRNMTFKKKDSSTFLKKRYQFINALNWLEKQPTSTSQKFQSWDQAKVQLSRIFQFSTLEDVEQQKEEDTTDDKAYLQKLDDIFSTGASISSTATPKATKKWKQIAGAVIPPKIVVEEDEQKQQKDEDYQSSVQKVDQLFTLRAKDAVAQLEKEALERRSKEERELEERLKEEERQVEARKRASSLMRNLTKEETEIVREAMYGIGNPQEILAKEGPDTVQRQNLQTLQPGQWLNDEVIHHFYLMLAKRDEDMCKQDPSRKRSHFFKSFFMTKLLNEGHANPSMEGQYEYRNVKRWSKKVPGKDLFALDKIFFPINQSRMHWVCTVIFMKEKKIQFFDSMGSSGQFYLESLLQYLKDEHQDKKKCPLPDADEWELVHTTRDTPQQRNGFDCGVFTCMFADFLSKECPLVFSQEHITQCRERIVLSIMNGKAIM